MSSTPLRVVSNVTEQPYSKPREPIPEPGSEKAPATSLPKWAIPGLAGALLVVGILGFALGSVSPTSDMAREIQQIKEYLTKGQPSIAIALAENALNQQNPAPSPQAKATIAGIRYVTAMDDLFATPSRDESTVSQMPLKWLAIEKKADTYQVPKSYRLAPMTVAQRAYSAGFWPLADAAFRKAWDAGDVGMESVGTVYAIRRNWGHWLAFATSSQSRDQGVRLLATAHALARAYSLQNDPACGDLIQLGYTDCNAVTPDSADPVLLAATKN